MKKVLVVVDMQKDFVDGALGTKEAVAIVDHVVKKITSFDGEVVFTRDTHHENYMETQEGKNLPVVHCIQGTPGWQLAKEIEKVKPEGAKIFDKPTFGSVELSKYLTIINEEEGIEEVELIGLCTDICVISNAMMIKAHMPEVKVTVDSSCCAGVTVESHNNALEAMKMCQIMVC